MKFVLTNQEHIDAAVDAVRRAGEKQGKPFEVVIQLVRESKTSPQNRHIHALIGCMADYCGQAPASMKDQMKRHTDVRWPKVEWQVFGEWVYNPKPTSDLLKDEATAVIEDLLRLCAEFSVPVPWEHQRIQP